jgi:hypothetical protein
MSRLPRVIATLAGLVTLVLGLWAFFDPRSFYDQLAVWPPYNRHFLHDVGAFQFGLGATLLGAAFVRDALTLALTGVGLGSALHAVSHGMDRNLGGRASDPYALGLLAVVILAGAVLRARELRKHR